MKRRDLFKFLAAAPLAALPSIAKSDPLPVITINSGANKFAIYGRDLHIGPLDDSNVPMDLAPQGTGAAKIRRS